MSLNQIINPSGQGLNLNCHTVLSNRPAPRLTTSVYNIVVDDMVKQRVLITASVGDNIVFTFPSTATLLDTLKRGGDALEIIVKYRSTGTITVNSVDNIFHIIYGTSYTLPSANGTYYQTAVIGVVRVNDAGTLRIY